MSLNTYIVDLQLFWGEMINLEFQIINFFLSQLLTFIMSRMVLRTMRVMMKYSNGVDSTILHSRYLSPTRSSGMYRSRGVALMAKSMQDFCKNSGQYRKAHPFNLPAQPFNLSISDKLWALEKNKGHFVILELNSEIIKWHYILPEVFSL